MKERIEGFVTAVHRDRYEVYVNGENFYARLKTGVYYSDEREEEFPTVGDNVVLAYNSTGDSLIIKTKERKSKFSRKDPDIGKGEQIIAANFDYVFIMMSLNFDFNLKRLERYITASWQSGAQPVIVLTKTDIAEDVEKKVELVSQIALGADIYTVSTITGEGMEPLKKYLEPDKTIVFLGSSGVGKSTFTNYLLGREVMETAGIREEDSKGHHTTTHRQLFVLDNGTKIIDTPGMRELGMWIVEDGMDYSFSDIISLAVQCRFSDCTHTGEPDCAVRSALQNGTLTDARWKNYLKLQRESDFQAEKESRNKSRESKKTNKKMVRNSSKVNSKMEEW
ncbi:ribosome small subunit-dependent GTPase A [Kineothrix sedimenti]|uniref:Small ribosomal subunit biogenesis GTPase RsgA n=1 Tax=Kineothrix sedimenti TaxID=3123317 RepID=A0ABZ3F0F8_9FIRM